MERRRNDRADTDADQLHMIDEESPEQIFLIKQEALAELKIIAESLELDTHNRYTLKDDLCDIQLEIRRLLILDERRQAIDSMRGTLSMVASGVEMANYQFGNYMELNGFSRHVTKESKTGRYDLPLQQLYKKHWKTGVGTGNPEYDLARALVTSAGMYHIKKSGMANEVMSQISGSK